MSTLSTYFRDLRDIYNTGSAVQETSYYSAFEAMANTYGKELKPRVRCVINIKNKGAGIPELHIKAKVERCNRPTFFRFYKC